MTRYAELHRASLSDPTAFWAEAARAIDWIKPPDVIFDETQGAYGRWFQDALCNTSYNCIDRHVIAGRGDQPALIYDSPVTQTKRSLSYADLLDDVETFAAVMTDLGVSKGDRVVIYMPMVPEAVIAMLAAARIGAVHSVVFGGFAAKELATRIDDATPKLIVTASAGIETNRIVAYKPLLDAALEAAVHKPAACIILQRPQLDATCVAGRDHDWAALVDGARRNGRRQACVAVAATDPLYILYTSGSTGQPKGIVRDHGGHMVALAWSMTNIYGVAPGEVFWSASDIGWVVGHSYIVYGPLLNGSTTVVYEGKPVGTPDAGAFWRVISDHDVVSLFTAPTAFRAIRKEDPTGAQIAKYDLAKLRSLFLAGERADPDTLVWAEDQLRIPVVDHWWQTETGWAIAANPIGVEPLTVPRGSAGVAMPGFDVRALDDAGHDVAPGTLGNIAIRLPLPPGCLVDLWNGQARFGPSYLDAFPGHYKTSDAGFIDADGRLFIMGRTDDIINVAGHRLSTGAMEEVLASHSDVAECAVIGANDALKGELPLGFVVLKSGVDRDAAAISREIVDLVRERIGPVAAFKTAMIVRRLPKTRSGKILRGTMKKIADAAPYKLPATIDDPAILDEIEDALKSRHS